MTYCLALANEEEFSVVGKSNGNWFYVGGGFWQKAFLSPICIYFEARCLKGTSGLMGMVLF